MTTDWLPLHDLACGFCGVIRTRCRVGRAGRDVAVCEECVAMCCTVASQSAGGPEPPLVGTRFDETWLAAVTANTERIRAPLLAAPPERKLREFQCSFCDLPRSHVAQLVSGPNVFICESCTLCAARELARWFTGSA